MKLRDGLLASHHVHLSGQTGAQPHPALVEDDVAAPGGEQPAVPGAPDWWPEVPGSVVTSPLQAALLPPPPPPTFGLIRAGAGADLGGCLSLLLQPLGLLRQHRPGLVLAGVEERPQVGLSQLVDCLVLPGQTSEPGAEVPRNLGHVLLGLFAHPLLVGLLVPQPGPLHLVDVEAAQTGHLVPPQRPREPQPGLETSQHSGDITQLLLLPRYGVQEDEVGILCEVPGATFRLPPLSGGPSSRCLRSLLLTRLGLLARLAREVPLEQLSNLRRGEVSSASWPQAFQLSLTSASALLGRLHFFKVDPFILASIDLLILWERMMFLALFLKDFFCL